MLGLDFIADSRARSAHYIPLNHLLFSRTNCRKNGTKFQQETNSDQKWIMRLFRDETEFLKHLDPLGSSDAYLLQVMREVGGVYVQKMKLVRGTLNLQ